MYIFHPSPGGAYGYKGTLWIFGDCYAHHFHDYIINSTLCAETFTRCEHTYNWVYPRWHPDPKKDKSIHMKHTADINVPYIVNILKGVLGKFVLVLKFLLIGRNVWQGSSV